MRMRVDTGANRVRFLARAAAAPNKWIQLRITVSLNSIWILVTPSKLSTRTFSLVAFPFRDNPPGQERVAM